MSQGETMVKRVAKAINMAFDDFHEHSTITLDEFLARAAIEAMRSPTEAMIDAGNSSRMPSKSTQFNTLGTWGDMIAAALSKDEGEG